MNTKPYHGLGLVNLGVACFAVAAYVDSGPPLMLFVIGVWFVVFGWAVAEDSEDDAVVTEGA